MNPPPVRVLYSFPHKLGAGRICTTAWHQIEGASRSGARVTVLAGSQVRPLNDAVTVRTTLALGKLRVPYKLVGRDLACHWHDMTTARWLNANHREVDVVHGWPLGSLRTIRTAKRHGIPVVLERPNAHTAYAYEEVERENRDVGIVLPDNHDHEVDPKRLALEETEYAEADYLLCPSDFVAKTFLDRGFAESKLVRHQYGYDLSRFSPQQLSATRDGLVMIYAGVVEPRKGLHHALKAWLASGAHEKGTFMVCGEFVPGYRERLEPMLSHPSVKIMGHRKDLPELMRQADLFVLSSVEEGSALVTYEARGSGCVLLVSDASGAVCEHGHDGLIHPMRDVEALTSHIRLLDQERPLLEVLRAASISGLGQLTWDEAGRRLADVYRSVQRRLAAAAA
ncbi:glycosyltransferase family 4 protein [Luteolibacter flavescens]|uniref:Glycosyltransferase family 4 protein n=1 Tax=Luteolibacter flavescens TaxID=1859460 RepID=A0ABT3FS03_9BACT|nr:glycosyltransferase family 4 protein [Luteolibacter flavescens]MCW1886362.1 glycosyltransferase family 4 protein [Luteolibacter flavescens]